MTKSPILNAAAATAYIIAVATVLYNAPKIPGPDTIFAPISVLSLLVLSAGMMVYFFLYQPVQLFFEGKREEAARLFRSTLMTFAAFTAIIISTMVLLSVFAR